MGQTIHDRIRERAELAQTYALDGAFYTAAGIFLKLAAEVEAHAVACDPARYATGSGRAKR